MEEDLGEEVTYDVNQHILFSLSIETSEIKSMSSFTVTDSSPKKTHFAELLSSRSLNLLALHFSSFPLGGAVH